MPEDDFLICGPSLASIPGGNLRETIMQIHRCMPRPNNWTPDFKYFKMPFGQLLIVFRPQCEETRQEHVGVPRRAAGPACPQPSSKAIKNTRVRLRKKTLSHGRACFYLILCRYSRQRKRHLHMQKGKGALVFHFTFSS